MTVSVKYLDFHWDNHQGGSGKSFEFKVTVVIPDDLPAKDVVEHIRQEVIKHASHARPFNQNSQPVTILGVVIV
jgi:hypothetical protein